MGRGLFSLLLVALCLAAAEAYVPKKKIRIPFPYKRRDRPLPQKRCKNLRQNSTDAADVLLSTRKDGSLYSDFLKGVRDWKFTGLLRRVSRGKVLIVPTNSAMNTRFVRLGLYKQPFKVPRSAILAFKKMIETDVAFPASAVKQYYGCGPLYVRHYVRNRFDYLKMIPYKKVGSGVRAAADEYELKYSILGTGYNSMTGFPLAMGMSSVDPGMTLSPIFTLNGDTVVTLGETGGSCKSQFSSSTYNSAAGMKESVGASLEITGAMGGIAFQGSASFNMVSETSTTSQTVTTNSGASVHLGGYALRGGPAALALEPGFVLNVAPLMEAAVTSTYDAFVLRSLVNNYGSHYIRTVWYGGIASVTNQMTSSSLSSLSSIGVSVSIAAQASMIQLSAKVDYNKESTNAVTSTSSTFSQVLIPASVPIALTSGDDESGGRTPAFIDCVEWTNSLRLAAEDQGWKAPVHYTIAPIHDIFSFPNLFPEDWRPYLRDMQKQVETYMKTCGYLAKDLYEWERNAGTPGYSACPAPAAASRCVTGTYKTSSGCNTCFGGEKTLGPQCNTTSTITCTAFACYCAPAYKNDPFAQCTPLAPNRPAPPAPSLDQLAEGGKKK